MKRIFPATVLNQHIAVLGKTGSGKSSVMRYIAESLFEPASDPVCIIDPKGDWWGLKSSKDGKGPGYPIVIFGGRHADVPITAMAGAAVGEIVASSGFPVLIDLGEFMVSERTRFMVDFLSTLFRKTAGMRFLFIDEVHNFAPQGKIMDPLSAQMLHWANRFASEGRGKGITLIAASQRPQKVHKDFLTSCETLIAMKVIHKLDRSAIADWLDGAPDQAAAKQVLAELANLQRGSAWVWSPEIAFGPKLLHFPMFNTYDSFKPQRSDAPLTGWADVDTAAMAKQLSRFVAEAEANDPRLLHKRIADLERQLEKPLTAPDMVPESRLLEVREQYHRDGYEKGFLAGHATAHSEAESLVSSMIEHVQFNLETAKKALFMKEQIVNHNAPRVAISIPSAKSVLEYSRRNPVGTKSVVHLAKEEQRISGADSKEVWAHLKAAPKRDYTPSAGDGRWPTLPTKRRMSIALKRSPFGITRKVWGVIAGIQPGGTLSNYVGEFTKQGLAENTGKVYLPTAALTVEDIAGKISLEELVELWSRHGTKPTEILRLVADEPRTRKEIGEMVGIQPGGTLSNYMGFCTSSGLVERRGDLYEISPEVLAWLEQAK